MTDADDDRGGPGRGAWRLTFVSNADGVELVSREWVDTVAPPVEDASVPADAPGAWAEVRDAGGSVLHQQVLGEVIRRDTEVFSPEPGAPIRRVPAHERRMAFQVFLPALDGADEVVLRESPAPAAGGPDAAVPESNVVLRVPLRRDTGQR